MTYYTEVKGLRWEFSGFLSSIIYTHILINSVFLVSCGEKCYCFIWYAVQGNLGANYSVNGAGKTEYSYANRWNWTPIYHHSQKLTWNGLKT